MHTYDRLRDTWIYQEIKQEIQSELYQQQITELRQTLLEITEKRFPRLEPLMQKVVERVTDSTAVRALIVQISTARIEKEARQSLQAINYAIMGHDHNANTTIQHQSKN